MIEVEYVDLNDLVPIYNGARRFSQGNQGMFCLFELVKTKQKVVAGNVHLHYNPAKDFVKFAQAAYILEKAS